MLRPSESQPALIDVLVGHPLQSLVLKDYSWVFTFADDVSLWTESAWRFMDAEHIVITSEDHQQKFGLPAPVDAAEWVLSRVGSSPVSAVSIRSRTGDLLVRFGELHELELLQMSSGYEAWHLHARGRDLYCLGGGGFRGGTARI